MYVCNLIFNFCFQTIMAFCPFVHALVRLMVSSTPITICQLSLSTVYSHGHFHPPVRYHTSSFPLPGWLSPLKSATYLPVASIPWAISKALLNAKSLSGNNLLCVFPRLFHTLFCLVSLSQVSHRNCSLPIDVLGLTQSLQSAHQFSWYVYKIYTAGQPRTVMVESDFLKLQLSLNSCCLSMYLGLINF